MVVLNIDTSFGLETPGGFRGGPLQRHQPVAGFRIDTSLGLETPSRWSHVFSVLCLDDKLSYHLVTRAGTLWTRPHQWPIFFIAVVTDSSSLDLPWIIALVRT